jgi:hypothetical protein
VSPAAPREFRRERGLFRLFIGLKALFWVVVLTVLIIGIVNAATGRHPHPPMALIWSLPLLALLQIGVGLVWWRTYRARQKRGAA